MKTHFLNKRLRLISLFSLLLLFSCGGDGDDDVQTVTPAPVAVVITAVPLLEQFKLRLAQVLFNIV